MASRRILKKRIGRIIDALFAECVAVSLYDSKGNHANVESALLAIAKTEENYLSRVSHIEPGMPAKAYFKDLISKFNVEISGIIDHIDAINS